MGDKIIEEEELVIGEKEVGEIATKVGEALLPQLETAIEEKIEAGQKAAVEAMVAATEEVDKKKLEDAHKAEVENDPILKGIEDKTIDAEIAEMSPMMRFYRQMIALVNEDHAELKRFNLYAIASQNKARKALEADHTAKGFATANKAGYANDTTAADGGVLVPDADFVTQLFENLPNYGVAFSDADVRQTDRTSVRVISLDSGLTFYSTAEAGVKTAAKLTFSKNEVSLQKYAVIVPATDELTDDAAIDYWNVVSQELTRAYAKKADEIVFTDSTGITNLSNVLTQTTGAGLDWDDMLTAQSKTEDDLDESNNKWYMRKETWYYLLMRRAGSGFASADGQGLYLGNSIAAGWVGNPNTPTTPWGTPVKFTRVLPTINSINANDGLAVYGDLRNFKLYNKRGMALKMLTEASIVDASSVTTNLATQDISAMRAVVRMLGICPNGNRTKFVVLGTGTVS